MVEWIVNHHAHRPRLRRHDHDSPKVLPDELIWEILSYLPAKSLMRFKSVTKTWQSIITDPSFARSHRGGLRGLLLCKQSSLPAPKTSFFYVNLDSPSSQICHHLTVNHRCGDAIYSNIVNGLVCFYHGNCSYLYNIATRERLKLPISTYVNPPNYSYHLGYDPINKLYKLLKTCPILVEILTVGVDSSWRIIDLPQFIIPSVSACLDGVLYWKEYRKDLIAFHLGEEKFQIIPMPRETAKKISSHLPSFGPNLALIYFLGKKTTLITQYVGGNGNGGESEGTWADVQKFNHPILPGFIPEGILPNGKMVIFDRMHKFCARNSYTLPIYLFDQNNGKLEKIVIGGMMIVIGGMMMIPAFTYIFGQKSYYEENIMPLRSLNSSPKGIVHVEEL